MKSAHFVRGSSKVAHRERGWIMIDVMFGLALLGLMGVALSVGIHEQRGLLGKLENLRAAAREDEAALIAAQARALAADSNVKLSTLSGDDAVAGYRWMAAQRVVDGRTVVIFGLTTEARP